ncbi:MAG: glycosyltransferase [Armatimonadota bacterium]
MSGISVIIPVYNCERFIRHSIDSALNQTLAPQEIIVIDDGSVDDTPNIVRSYGERVRYIRTENSGHPSIARNVGIDASHGDIIAFLDADDVWHQTKLSDQMDMFNRIPDLQMAYTDYECIDEHGNLIPDAAVADRCFIKDGRVIPDIDQTGDLVCQLFLRCFIQTSTVVVRKPALDRVGHFDTGLVFVEDADLWMRLAYSGCVERFPAVRSSYRVHAANLSHRRLQVMFDSVKRLSEKTLKMVADDPVRSDFIRRATRLVLASALVTTAYAPVGISRCNRVALLCRALLHDPLMWKTEPHVWKNAIKLALGLSVGLPSGCVDGSRKCKSNTS